MSAVELAHSVPTRMPVPLRNSRRLNCARPMARSGVVCVDMLPPLNTFIRRWKPRSGVMAVALQHLDLVAVGVLHKEEASDEPIAVLEFLDVVGDEAPRFHARVFGVEIVDA